MLCTLPWPALTRFGPTFSRTSRGGKTGQQAFLWLFLFCPLIRLAICELILYKSNHYHHPPPPPYCPIYLSLLLSFHLLVSPSCCASLHSASQPDMYPSMCMPSKHAGSESEAFWLQPVRAITASVQPELGWIVDILYARSDFLHLIQFHFSYKGPDHIVQNPYRN